jgi:hypothetical protein
MWEEASTMLITLECTATPRQLNEALAERVMPYEYDAIYGAFWNAVIPENANHAMEVSFARHIEWLEREAP